MTRALVLTGNSPRHIYFANRIAEVFDLRGIISEPKYNYFSKQIEMSQIVASHFDALAVSEKHHMGSYLDFPNVPLLSITKSDINSKEAIEWLDPNSIDIILLFGTGILSNNWIKLFQNRIINLHLGYSPRYRGSATLFWPFANDEIQYLGTTIHLADEKIDSGDILKIIKPEIISGDSYYDITTKLIKKSIDCFSSIVVQYLQELIVPIKQNRKEQKYLYKKSDFNEEILSKVLKKYGH